MAAVACGMRRLQLAWDDASAARALVKLQVKDKRDTKNSRPAVETDLHVKAGFSGQLRSGRIRLTQNLEFSLCQS